MIKSQTVTKYSVGDGLPAYSHLPHGYDGYNRLLDYHELDQLENLIRNEISDLNYDLNKYDSPYEPENATMCADMRHIKHYLEECLNSIQKLQSIKLGENL